MDTERDKKRKEFEPYIDAGGLDDAKPLLEPEGEVVATKKWMSEAMKELKERTDDMSELERSMTKARFDMNDVKENLNKVTEALTKISDDNNTRDRKFDDFIKSINTGLHERDKKTDEKIERLEGQINTKIEEEFAGLETRIGAIERGTTEAGCRRLTESKEQDVKAIVMKSINATGMKEEHTLDYPAHVFVEFEDTRTRDRFVR